MNVEDVLGSEDNDREINCYSSHNDKCETSKRPCTNRYETTYCAYKAIIILFTQMYIYIIRFSNSLLMITNLRERGI